eukprot:m.99822 g.99822  ORF g.99822 m.99822 type:complete len:121 (+) comp51447_c0_seq22:386-748(+)
MIFPIYKHGSLLDHITSAGYRGVGNDDCVWTIFQGALPWERSLQRDPSTCTFLLVSVGVCEAVQHLHRHQPEPFAHRDIKAANVLLSDDDSPVLIDFGSMAKVFFPLVFVSSLFQRFHSA